LNTHFEEVSDHRDKHDSFFSGLLKFLTRRDDSVDTVLRYFSQCLHALEGVTAQKKSFRSDHRSQSTHRTHAADLILARALGQTKRYEVVERRAMARQQNLNEIYRVR
jgi:hypothetical protein